MLSPGGEQHIPGSSVELVENNFFHWTATVTGPAGSPFEHGRFALDMEFAPDYPFLRPRVSFKTKVYHPSVNSATGYVSLGDEIADRWQPSMTVANILQYIIVILGEPDEEHVVVPEIWREYVKDRDTYNRKAREWTEKYAC